MRSFLRLLLAIISLILSACSGEVTPTAYFLPPTGAPQAAAAFLPTPTSSTSDQAEPEISSNPTSAPSCTPNLLYLEDLTVPDGTVVTPGETLDKRWLAENNGSCNWDVGYSLVLLAGPQLGAPKKQALFPARSGTQAEVRIIFKAPQEPGSYRSAWQAKDPQGNLFGDPIYIDIVVQSP